MIEPLELIQRIRDIYPERCEWNTNGCFKTHLLLKAVYPQATGWYNGEHILTQIDGEIYDIDGIAERTSDYLPLERCHSDWSMFTKTTRPTEIL